MQAEKHKLLLPWARPSEKDEGSAGGSVLGMQRDRASGSPAAEVQGAFCLSENQIIYYQK